jgi:hypothetical protein
MPHWARTADPVCVVAALAKYLEFLNNTQLALIIYWLLMERKG